MGGATTLWLDPIPVNLRQQALTAFEAGEAVAFLVSAGNQQGLELVFHNFCALKHRGIYENALLHAYTATRVDWSQYSTADSQSVPEVQSIHMGESRNSKGE